MQNKSEFCTHITNFINLIENQFDTQIKIRHTNNGKEIFMHDFFHSKESFITSCIETP